MQLVCDNASNNTKALDVFVRDLGNQLFDEGKHLHGQCACHVIALIAGECLDHIKNIIKVIRDNNRTLNNKPKQHEMFEAYIEGSNNIALKRMKRPSCDVATRYLYYCVIMFIFYLYSWNSTTDMLTSSFPYRDIYNTWYERNGLCAEIKNQDWINAENYNSVLSPLKDMTIMLSKSNAPTMHLVVPLMHFL